MYFGGRLSVVNILDFVPFNDGINDDVPALQKTINFAGQADAPKTIFLPNGNYRIASNLSIPANIVLQFDKNALLIPDTGVTITFLGEIVAGLYQIFSGAGTIVFNKGRTVYPEWWGAAGDSVTNDQAAIQAAIKSLSNRGTVEFQAKTYVINSPLVVNKSYIGLIGKGKFNTRIAVTGGTIDGIQVSGVVGTPISSNVISGMYIYHTATAVTGSGIALSYTTVCKITDVQVADFLYGVTMSNASNTLAFQVVASCSSGTAAFIGFNILTNCISSVWRDCWATAVGNTGTTIGFKVSGALVHDYQWIDCATASCSYGWSLDGSLDVNACDLHIRNPIIDQFTFQGISISGFTQNASITIVDGWINPSNTAAETDAIYITGSRGITITGTQFMAITGWANSWGVKIIASSSDVIIQGCLFNAQWRGVYILNSNNCIIKGNMFRSNTGQAAYMIIYAQTATYLIISDNNLEGYSTYGVYLDTAANKCNLLGNVIVPTNITTPITNLGTGSNNVNNIIT